MLRKLSLLLLAALFYSGMFTTLARAETFVVLDNVTFEGPFIGEGVVTSVFVTPASAESIELVITYHSTTPDRCCSQANYGIFVSLEGQDPAGDWHPLVRDVEEFNNSVRFPTRVLMLDRNLVSLNGSSAYLGEYQFGTIIHYMFGEVPRNLRVRFEVLPEPVVPPGATSLQRFTVSVSGRAFAN